MYRQVREYLPYLPTVMGNKFGLEIEMEGMYLPPYSTDIWNRIGDGSLRGNACEYLFREPQNPTALQAAVEDLIRILKVDGRFAISDRCGIHIHTNVQNLRLNHMFNMLVLYFIVENILIERFSPERKGNLFCLQGMEAEGVIDWISHGMINGLDNILRDSDPLLLKYAALNISSLNRFGTLEFRAMSTPSHPDGLMKIIPLVKIFSQLKSSARDYTLPRQIIEEISSIGPKEFFAKHYSLLEGKVDDLENKIFEGVRLVQEIAYLFPAEEQENESQDTPVQTREF